MAVHRGSAPWSGRVATAATYRAKLAELQWPVQPAPDDRLRLMFTCCHPALSREAQVALTLRIVCGLTTAQIAAAFVTPETTVAQRLTRAKKKIASAGIPYRIPTGSELPERLGEVLAVIYLLFNEGYLSSTSDRSHSCDLVDDAEWLAALLAGLMPNEPEVAGLLALIRLHRAIAVRHAASSAAAVGELDQLGAALDRYPLFHATRAELLRDLGRPEEAADADRRALELTANPAQQALLEHRLDPRV